MAALAKVFPRTAEFADERLMALGGVDVAALAADQGTPLYVLDRAELVGRMRDYRSAFGPDTAVVYAAKALCVVGVLQIAAAEGLHVDVASAGELHTAAAASFPMERVVLHGNNKSEDELQRALDLGVGRIAVDHEGELEHLANLTESRDAPVDILLRVTPGVGAGGHEFIRTGQEDSKFGFSFAAGLASMAIDRVVATPGLVLRGLHCHIGSQISGSEALRPMIHAMARLLAYVADRHGRVLEELNVGGGLGIPYTPADEELSIREYAAAVRQEVGDACARFGLDVPRLAVEPGRSIVGPAGVTLYRVGAVKEVPEVRTFVAVDGGMSDNIRPALYGARYTFAAAGSPSRSTLPGVSGRPVTVVGKHCESGDVLGTDVVLPTDLAVGDLLAAAATGAYTHSMAGNYNRLPRPAMVLVGDGQTQLLVRRETLDDVVARDLPLEM